MNAAFFLTQHKLEQLKRQEKRQQTIMRKKIENAIKNRSIKEDIKLRSIMSQIFCTIALQIELLDELEKSFYLNPVSIFYKFKDEFIKMNNEQYKLAIKNEKDDIERQRWENMVKNIVCNMSELNVKQLELLENFIINLKNKK